MLKRYNIITLSMYNEDWAFDFIDDIDVFE